MTKKERALIKKAIQLIHIEDQYYEGMDILAELVGYEPFMPKLPKETISIAEFIEIIKKDPEKYVIR